MKQILFLFAVLLKTALSAHAQSTFNLDSLIASKATNFSGGNQFSGKSWDHLVERARSTGYVLIGEDHFISEVPLFTRALMQNLKVDNYICEMDQWTLDIFRDQIRSLTDARLQSWISANYNGFSFFQKKNEFDLLPFLLKRNVNLIGIEQVGLTWTTMSFQYLVDKGSQKNRKFYELMRDSSSIVNNVFLTDQSKPFFFQSACFNTTMAKLDRSAMSKDELALTTALIESAEIYKTGSHRRRIKLMQANMMSQYPHAFKGKKNVLKFGANHTIKGESYLPVIDIGTTAHIMAQAENMDSYHILIMPKAGSQAGFLGGSSSISLDDEPYRSLKPLFEKCSSTEWSMVDLEGIRSEVRKNKIAIKDPFLEKTLMGYDVLVVIPSATPAESLR